ncbi:unnamed protein product, partial [marine sediment metagenome]
VPPVVFHLRSEIAEAQFVARIAREALSEKRSVLVLAPRKEFFPLIAHTFSRYGVPFTCSSNLLHTAVYSRWEVIKRLIEWAKNPNNNLATRAAIEAMIDGVGVPGIQEIEQRVSVPI